MIVRPQPQVLEPGAWPQGSTWSPPGVYLARVDSARAAALSGPGGRAGHGPPRRPAPSFWRLDGISGDYPRYEQRHFLRTQSNQVLRTMPICTMVRYSCQPPGSGASDGPRRTVPALRAVPDAPSGRRCMVTRLIKVRGSAFQVPTIPSCAVPAMQAFF
jgi:hypothetical protein